MHTRSGKYYYKGDVSTTRSGRAYNARNMHNMHNVRNTRAARVSSTKKTLHPIRWYKIVLPHDFKQDTSMLVFDIEGITHEVEIETNVYKPQDVLYYDTYTNLFSRTVS